MKKETASTKGRKPAEVTISFAPCKCGQRHDKRVSCVEARDTEPVTRTQQAIRWNLKKSREVLPLTSTQRKEIFRGGRPKIEYSYEEIEESKAIAKIAEGKEVRLNMNVSLRVTGTKRTKSGGKLVSYEVTDKRLAAERLLRARPHAAATPERRSSAPQTQREREKKAEEEAAASEESSYTRNPRLAMRGEGEPVSRAEQEEITKQSREQNLARIKLDRENFGAALDRIKESTAAANAGTSVLEFTRDKMESHFDGLERRVRAGESPA